MDLIMQTDVDIDESEIDIYFLEKFSLQQK